ncbi:hypothetical protein [Pluralibacter gergoviae]|uniref:hypothetical protein n=1 Tax=Pluralibacter gergoviae TaxID=61647 RepID=UPI000AAD22FE|nr:hypothetical protein [Pluralibacter gergoviae]
MENKIGRSCNVDNLNVVDKFKSNNHRWGFSHPASAYNRDSRYELITSYIGETEFAIYERSDSIFYLVDFFKNYDDAIPYAKNIIDEHPDLRKMFHNLALN